MKAIQLFLALWACVCGASAQAQLRLPGGGLPALPSLPPSLPAPLPALPPPAAHAASPLRAPGLRATLVGELLRDHADVVEPDPAGQPVRRGELLWLSPPAAAVDAARREGFTLLRDQAFPELELRELVLGPPPGMALADGLARLLALAPAAQASLNPLYLPGGGAVATVAPMAGNASRVPRAGLIDGGVDTRHPDFAGAHVLRTGCEGRELPSAHGTAVASLLQASTLYAADVYCGQAAGGAADEVARAMAWMLREGVPVVNVSLVGPPNPLLERATVALVRRGQLVVAAVGNDGPAAPPLYPASYPGVVGVTGVLASHQALPEAAQGPQVMFAAEGADVPVALPGGGHARVRGTSYAAPRVARLLARRLSAPDPQAAQAALAGLAREALDLGAPGRDPVYGFGLVGERDAD